MSDDIVILAMDSQISASCKMEIPFAMLERPICPTRLALAGLRRNPELARLACRGLVRERTILGSSQLSGSGTDDATILNRLRMLAAADDGMGEIFKALEETGELDNTIVVVTSDHGYFYGEHGLGRERRLAYEETARVPLFVRYPRMISPGSEIDPFVLSVDNMPTLLEMAGATVPDNLHGRSLVPLLQRTGEVDLPEAFVVETEYWDSKKIGAYTDEWKMILNLDNQRGAMRQELQRMGVEENGRRTDLGQKHFDVLQELLKYVRQWESQNPRVPSTLPDRDLPKEVVDQLRTLGYVH